MSFTVLVLSPHKSVATVECCLLGRDKKEVNTNANTLKGRNLMGQTGE